MGEEETWQTPSILVATLASSGGKIVFSQIHLEADPAEYENKEDVFEALKESNAARLEILSDLLSTHLEIEINRNFEMPIVYTPAYLLSQTENVSINSRNLIINDFLINNHLNQILHNQQFKAMICHKLIKDVVFVAGDRVT